MKISVSNIAWSSEFDEKVYGILKKKSIRGLEIAPTRIFPEDPYSRLDEAKKFSYKLKAEYNLDISSIQAIWFARKENMFSSPEERGFLYSYAKRAIDFAAAVNCGNIVFGCPKNRNMPPGADSESALSFFKKLGDYAFSKKTVIGMEANPAIYGTNYINFTEDALRLIKLVDSAGFKLNLDLGTVIANEETLDVIYENSSLVNHVHISEPNLKIIRKRNLHKELADILNRADYGGFVSLEMGRVDELSELERTIDYLTEIFA